MSKEVEVREFLTVRVLETVKGRPRVMEGARVVIEPEFDASKGTTALRTGVTRVDWDKFYKELYGDYDKFYADFRVILTAQTRNFDLAEPLNKLTAALLKNHSFVAKELSDITQNTMFILYDEIDEATKENKAFEWEVKAYKYLLDMSENEKSKFLKLFGVAKTSNTSPEVIMKRLKDIAKTDPKLFVETFEDKTKDIKILIEELLQSKILRKIGGMYYFGDNKDGIPLGSSIEQAVDFIRNPKNNDLVIQITKMQDAKKVAS